MIRRHVTQSDGSKGWLLVPQIDHAQLSGRLAEHWGSSAVLPLDPRDEVIAAVFHHDDGWAEWDRQPDVDPHTGEPFDFTEMSLDASLEIWRHSIESAARYGPLSAHAVSGHFSVLLRRSDRAELPASQEFLTEQESQRAAWLVEWQQQHGDRKAEAVADQALAHLQLFDLLSLWLCCAERHEPWTVSTPGDVLITLAPGDGSPSENGHEITVAPWPLTTAGLDVEVPGRLVAASTYPDRAALAAAPATATRLRWRFRPPSASA